MKKQKKNIIRKLYDWVLHWADTPYGTYALAGLAFTESSFFPIPPDVLQIALGIGNRNKSLFYALISTLFSVSGAFLGYFIGYFLMDKVGNFVLDMYNLQNGFLIVKEKFNDNAFLAILGAAFTPIPYKVFTIASGACKTPLLTLFTASIIGRGARFFAVGSLIFLFGEKIKSFIDKYFNILSLAFFVLLVLGFLVIKFFAD